MSHDHEYEWLCLELEGSRAQHSIRKQAAKSSQVVSSYLGFGPKGRICCGSIGCCWRSRGCSGCCCLNYSCYNCLFWFEVRGHWGAGRACRKGRWECIYYRGHCHRYRSGLSHGGGDRRWHTLNKRGRHWTHTRTYIHINIHKEVRPWRCSRIYLHARDGKDGMMDK